MPRQLFRKNLRFRSKHLLLQSALLKADSSGKGPCIALPVQTEGNEAILYNFPLAELSASEQSKDLKMLSNDATRLSYLKPLNPRVFLCRHGQLPGLR